MSSKTPEVIFLKRLGLRLRQIRNEKDLTLEDVEARGYPSWRHLQKVEAGKNFNVVTLYRLSRVYKMSLNEIMDGVS
jgi:transcriptional regulator with XRE-family HTH domain